MLGLEGRDLGFFSERCTEKLPLRVDFIHRVEFGEVESRDQSKRDPAASQSQSAGKPVPASHARDSQNLRAGGHLETQLPSLQPPPHVLLEGLLDHTL